MKTLHSAWATPALSPRGRGGIFGGLVQHDAKMTDARGELTARTWREGRRSGKPPTPRAHNKAEEITFSWRGDGWRYRRV